MHIEHRIALNAHIMAGREPDRQALVGQACGGNALVFEQPAPFPLASCAASGDDTSASNAINTASNRICVSPLTNAALAKKYQPCVIWPLAKAIAPLTSGD
jgi:hypothetical protein